MDFGGSLFERRDAEFRGNVERHDGLALTNAVASVAAIASGAVPYLGDERVEPIRLRLRYPVIGCGEVHGADFLDQAEAAVHGAGGIAVIPSRVQLDGINLCGPQQFVVGSGLRRADDGD